MSSGLGYFDTQGIWRYGEDDAEALFSDALNVGQESVSDQFAVDRARMDGIDAAIVAATAGLEDTGWIAPVLAGTWVSTVGATVEYRRLNGVVYLRGRASGGATGAIFTLPVGFRPTLLGTSNLYLAQNGSTVGAVTQLGLSAVGDGIISGVGGAAPVLTAIPPFIAEA